MTQRPDIEPAASIDEVISRVANLEYAHVARSRREHANQLYYWFAAGVVYGAVLAVLWFGKVRA